MGQRTTPPSRIPSDTSEKSGRRDSRTPDHQTQNKFSPGTHLEKSSSQLIPRELPKVPFDVAVERLVGLQTSTIKGQVRGFSVLTGKEWNNFHIS